jgi:transglutaminase-like putative cysteine protease
MRDAAIDRLAKVLAEKQTDEERPRGTQPRKTTEVQFGMAEGWFSLILLAIVVYSTIWCVQVAGWVDHLSVLTITTGLGLAIGVYTAKQRRFATFPVHLVAISFGVLLALWQTSGAFYQGNVHALFAEMQHWFVTTMAGGSGEDDSLFLLFIILLGYILAYASAWLLYRARNPWLVIIANALVLLINLSNVDSGFIIFLVVFLVASLLLLLRFNLYESMKRWRRQGLRYPDDIGWDIMQAGAIISVSILVLSWILPGTYVNETAAQLWNISSNPWVQAENTWNRMVSLSSGVNAPNHGNFQNALTLGGNPNLNHDIVMNVKTTDNTTYYETLSYESYDSSRSQWSDGPIDKLTWKVGETYPINVQMVSAVRQDITIVNPPGEQYPYILGAPNLAATNVASNVERSKATGQVVDWLNQGGALNAGAHYAVVSYVSSADVQSLRVVPLPKDAPVYPSDYDGTLPVTSYDNTVVATYLKLPNDLDPRIPQLAKQVTASSSTMYDKVVALESYLRDHYAYDTNIHLPAGDEGVSWFLFNGSNRGFCNYFASAMTVMARELGIPARVVAGYTNGELDAKTHQRVIRGTDAHAWVQVYFAGYGWVNFEPSASFATFNRPLPTQTGNSGVGSTSGSSSVSSLLPSAGKGRTNLGGNEITTGGSQAHLTPAQQQAQVRQQVGIATGSVALLLLCASLLFLLWWRRLFHTYSLPAQLYGRLCVLASWSGIHLKPSQTPYECIQGVVVLDKQDALTLERIGDIYVRDVWANPESIEHPRRSGEIAELPMLWRRLQLRLYLHLVRQPSFWLAIPHKVGSLFSTVMYRRKEKRRRRLLDKDF